MQKAGCVTDLYHRIEAAETLRAFFARAMSPGMTRMVHVSEKPLRGNFRLLGQTLSTAYRSTNGIPELGQFDLRCIRKDMQGFSKPDLFKSQITAIDEIISDMDEAELNGYSQHLCVIRPDGYVDKDEPEIQEYHADGEDDGIHDKHVVRAYCGPVPDELRNEDAISTGRDRFGALTYKVREGSKPFNFPVGTWIAWRKLSQQGDENLGIHRAATMLPDDPARLLLYCDPY